MKRQCYGIVLSIALLGGCSQPHAETQSTAYPTARVNPRNGPLRQWGPVHSTAF